MVNAWKMHVMCARLNKTKPLSQFEFRSAVTVALLLESVPEPEEEPEPPADTNSDEDELVTPPRTNIPAANVKSHIVARSPVGKHRRCKVCKKHTIYVCTKCNVHLHTGCFPAYPPHQQ